MNKIIIAQIISGLSVVVGIAVVIGWYFDITILTSILPIWIRMKFATAVCFILSGITIYFLTFKKDERVIIRQSSLIIFPSLITLIMSMLFFGSVFGFQTGLENIAFIDVHEINTPIFQGRPSVATMISFILIAYIGFSSSININFKKSSYILSLLVSAIGLIGTIGYLINEPVLYYEIVGFSNAIAIHTAILLALLGSAISLICQYRNHEKEHKN